MKRSELKVGETYAVLAPSQTSGYATARKVTVLDLEPKWRERYSGFSWRRDVAKVKVKNADGIRVDAADHAEATEPTNRDAKRSVLVVEERTWHDYMKNEDQFEYIRKVVPLSNIRMTWNEYEVKRRAFDRAQEKRWREQDRQRKEADDRKAAAAALRDALNTKLEDSPFNARVLDGEVVLAGPYDALVKLVEGGV